VDRAIQEKVAIITQDAMSDDRFPGAVSVMAFRIRSAACIPLIAKQKVLGIIHLDTRSARHVFTGADLALLTGAAGQAAMALENARLYTDLRRAYEERQRAQDQLVRSEKLSTIGTLSASIAHDIGNIVTPLIPLSEMLLQDSNADPLVRRVFENQLPQLVALTRRLLSFSATRSLAVASVDINRVVSGALDLLRTEAIHQGVQIVFEPHPDNPTVLGDVSELDRVVLNLALNAVQAMETGHGTLTVTVAQEEDEVSISVADTGPGIPPEHLPALFQPFFSTKESGTGMGLFSCKRIVEEEHGGVIEVESQPGEGTVFTVRLPKRPPELAAQISEDESTDGGET
jgi:signal transduction histidine kinase